MNKTFNNVNSMRLSEIPGVKPTRTLMVLERAPGVPMDKFIDDTTANLTNDGVINADDNPAAAPKERRFMAIWP